MMTVKDIRHEIAVEAMKAILKSGDKSEASYIGKRAVACADSLLAALSDNKGEKYELWIWYGGERVPASKVFITDLTSEFSPRVRSALIDAGITSAEDLADMSRTEIMNIPRIGAGLRKQIFNFLEEHGLYIAE